MKEIQIGIPCGPNSEDFSNFLIKTIEKTISRTKTYSYLIAINKPEVDKNKILSGLSVEIEFIERHSKKIKSEGHADALNLLLKNAESENCIFVDADVAFLKDSWDIDLLSELNEKTVMIGTEYHHSDGKMVKRPNVITCAFKTKILKNLNVNFMPSLEWLNLNEDNCQFFGKNPGDKIFLDTGCDMMSSLISSGYDTKILEIVSPRYSDTINKLSFLNNDDRGEEYHLNGKVLCTHIGRSLSRNFEKDPVIRKWRDAVVRWHDGKI